MKPEIDRIMRIVNDYRTGEGGLTESFVRKEIEYTIKDLVEVKNLANVPVSGQLPLDFVKWFSGMQEEKILKAYKRWKKESGNLR